jgi:hypothetical protein
MAGLADRVYIPLYNKDATYDTEAVTGHRYAFKWELPTLDARRGPVCYLSLKNCAIEGTVENTRQCLWLRVNNIFSENVKINEKNSPIVGGTILAMLDFRGNTDHYAFLPESALKIQMSTNMKYLVFDIIDSGGNVESIDSADTTATINLLLQIEYPPHNQVPDTTVMSYAQSEIGNPPFSKLKL